MATSVTTRYLFLCLLLVSSGITQSSRVQRSDDTNPWDHVVQEQAATIRSLQADMAVLKNSVNTLSGQAHKAVAFTAFFSSNPVTLAPHGPLRFDDVTTNIGNGYDKTTGVFTAPYSGLYVFLLSVMVRDNTFIQVAIDKSGTTLAVAHADDTDDRWDKGMTHVTTHLNAGDQVWARQNYGGTAIYGDWWTSFSGFLVYAD